MQGAIGKRKVSGDINIHKLCFEDWKFKTKSKLQANGQIMLKVRIQQIVNSYENNFKEPNL